MGIQILNKDVSIISSIGGIAKASINNIGGVPGWSGGGTDVIPDALNWTDITDATSYQTSRPTISGIDTSITLRIESDYDSNGAFSIFVNDVEYDMTFDIESNGFYNKSVNNGDKIYFYRFSSLLISETVTVKNSSDSNVVLDTFTITLTGGV